MSADVGTIRISLVANTASFDGPLDKSQQKAKNAAKGIQDSFDGIDLSDAKAGLMVLDEELGIHIPRHVTALISQLPGLQTAFAAAFPLLAVVAVGKALGDMVEKEQKHAEEMARQREEVLGLASAMESHANALEISNMKLQDQIRLLTGKPAVNGPKELALETQDALKKLEKEYDAAIAKIGEFAAANQQGMIMTALTGDDGSRELAGMIVAHQAAQEKIKKDKLAAEADGNQAGLKAANEAMESENKSFNKYIAGRKQAIQNEIAALAKPHETTQIDKDGNATQVTDQLSMADAITQVNIKYADQMPLLNSIVVLQQQYKKAVDDTNAGAGIKGQKDVLTAIQQNVELENKAYNESKEIQQAKDRELIASAKQQVALGTMTADQLAKVEQDASEREFQAEQDHNQKLLTIEAGNPAMVRATNAKIEADAANHRAKMTEIATQGIDADNREFQKWIDEEARAFKEQETQAAKAAAFDQKQIQDKAKLSLLQNSITTDTAKQNTEQQLATGQITKQQAAEQNLVTARADQKAQLQIINDELDAQREKLVLIGKATNGGTTGTDEQNDQYKKALEAYQQTENQKLEITKKTNAEIAAANKAAADNETAQWRKMFQEYGQLSKGMNQTARQAFGQIDQNLGQLVTTGKADFRGMAQSMTSDIVQLALKYAESKLFMAASDNDFIASALAAMGIHTAAQVTANVTEAQSSTATAGANTLADVPFPENIPAAATVTGIGEGFTADAAAARGALLPNREMNVRTHPEEMILPRHISNFIVKSAGSQVDGGDKQPHYTYSPQINAGAATAKELNTMMAKQNEKQMRKVARQRGVRF
jgi:hypothetical protein